MLLVVPVVALCGCACSHAGRRARGHQSPPFQPLLRLLSNK
jgi:hypothetical protein